MKWAYFSLIRANQKPKLHDQDSMTTPTTPTTPHTPLDEHCKSPCHSATPSPSPSPSEQHNLHCFCISLPEHALQKTLEEQLHRSDIYELIKERCPHLFAARPVFISAQHAEKIRKVIAAIESVIALPAYRAQVLSHASAIASHDAQGAQGVFFAYDFHLHEDDIGLIEINTNAGGAMLNSLLAKAQEACCVSMQTILHNQKQADEFEAAIGSMFQHEWQLAHPHETLQTIAIIDENADQQYLYPEFLLFQAFFEERGINCLILNPEQVEFHDQALWHGAQKIDLVYNRLTDFNLEQEHTQALRAAYLANAVVLTPHPQAHALYADKANLKLLSDATQLSALGVATEVQELLLQSIPSTLALTTENAEQLWQERRHYFFKPRAGFGGRATYRGDKLTKRVWEEILAHRDTYIAQKIALPGARMMGTPEHPEQLKFDLRFYTYLGQIQWIGARVYQGQTTNFRTPGGGFAPVFILDNRE